MLLTYRKIKRYQKIISTFLKYGFGDLISKIKGDLIIRIGKNSLVRVKAAPKQVNIYGSFRRALEELGPTFIKFGQFLSTKEELLPQKLTEELANLQDRVKPVPFEKIKKEIDFTVFSEFSDVPISAASISQVYKAVLQNGETVAVKVKRPGIDRIIDIDFEILSDLAALSKKYKLLPAFLDPVGFVEEFRKAVTQELDFQNEVGNIVKFHNFFKNEPRVIIPYVYTQYSNKNIIVMRYIDGKSIKESAKSKDFNREAVANILLEATFRQIFEFSFFHADPHPSNIFIVDKDKIAFLDFGLIGYIGSELMKNISDGAIALKRSNIKQFIRILMRMDIIPENVDMQNFRRDIEYLFEKYRDMALPQINIRAIILEAHELVKKYELTLPRYFALLLRAAGLVESIAREIFPDVSFDKVMNEYGKKLLFQKFSARAKINELTDFLIDMGSVVKELPENIDFILRKIRRGELKLKFDLTEIKDFIDALEDVANRLILGVVLASMILASALLIKISAGPQVYGISVISLGAFILSFLLAIMLVISIIKSRFK